ncbi:MAG: fasciclin domain-containing protein [Aureisphaera sp.]
MKNFLKLTLTLLLTLAIVSCSDDDDNGNVMDPGGQTIADFVADNADYSTLLAALDRAGLVSTLDGTTNYTVFAPNNTAFDAFLTANNFTSLDDVPTDVLTNVLLNHVVNGTVLSTQLTTGYVNTLGIAVDGLNLSMFVDTTSGVTLNGQSSVATADVEVDNGVIHAVDAVIGLPTVVTFATADPTFSTLVAALTRSDQPDFVGILSTPDGTAPAPFTVFAPTNDAFGDLLTELGAGSLDDIDTATLTATLNLHVIGEANVRSTDLTDGPVTTLGGDVTVDATNATITDSNGRVSNIIVVDVQAINGVVHAIDKVILPTL